MDRDNSSFHSFAEFYPFYLDEHRDRTSRRLHVVGTGLVLSFLGLSIVKDRRFAWAIPVTGYGFAWFGHFFFEKNRPATFKHPLWSLMGDFRMFFETVAGKRAF